MVSATGSIKERREFMPSPILFTKSAFDADLDTVFTFSYTGDQVFKNRLVIRNNADNTIVYDQTVTSFQLEHTVSSGSLVNGTLYNAVATVFNSNNEESTVSNTVVFYCFSTPSWGFLNLVSEQVIQNSSFQASLEYTQTEGEELDVWSVILYDSRKQQISTSGTIYDTASLSYNIQNLEDNGSYYLRATGQTINGMTVDTGYISFSVEYVQPSTFALVGLENRSKYGDIKISPNIVSIIGTSNPDPATFINKEMVDLSESGTWVKFDEGFSIEDNFTLQLTGKSLKDHSPIINLSNGERDITVEYHTGTFDDHESAYFILKVTNGLLNYVINSDYSAIPAESDMIMVWIRRIKNVYEIKHEILEV